MIAPCNPTIHVQALTLRLLINACDLSRNILVSFTVVEFGSNVTRHSRQ